MPARQPQARNDAAAPVYQDLGAFRLPSDFRGRSTVLVQIWWIIQVVFFGCSPQFLYGWRRAILRLFGARIGAGVLIRPSARVTYPWKLTIRDRAWIGDSVTLYSLCNITIGHDAVISQGSYLCTGTHNIRDPAFPIEAHPIVVEDEAWVASHVFVGPGVKIGRGAVVGVRSLLLRDVPPGMVAMGHPARIAGRRVHGLG